LRLGVQEVSWHGMGVDAMDELAAIITAVLREGRDPEVLAARTRALLAAHRPTVDTEEILQMALRTLGVEAGA
jgi:glycine/serine hydroxymethyltransferase